MDQPHRLLRAQEEASRLVGLLFEAERPGTEILHPVAVVIFSGLTSSTLLDTFLTPAMFWLFGRQAALDCQGGSYACNEPTAVH